MAWLLSIALVAQVSVDGAGDCVAGDEVGARLGVLLAQSGESLRIVVEAAAGSRGNHEVVLRVTESGRELLARSYQVAPGDCGGVTDLLELVLRQFLRDLPASRVPVGGPPPPSRPARRRVESAMTPTTYGPAPGESEPPAVSVRVAAMTGPEADGGWGGGGEVCAFLALGSEGHKLVISTSQRMVSWQGDITGITLFGVGWHFYADLMRGGLEVRTGLRVGGGAVNGRTELLAWLAMPVGPVALGPLAVLASPNRSYLAGIRPVHEPSVLLLGVAGTLNVWGEKK